MSDSTNVEREGRSLTEREVQTSLDRVFAEAKGRIVITLFSSHIQRIQEVFSLAEHYGRTVVISGRSLANNIEMARNIGLIHVPDSFYNAFEGVPDLPPEKEVLVVTGAQGEPMSALSRMAFGAHRQLELQRGDTVVMSSRVIPGNARAVSSLINEMYRQGAEVLYESVRAMHASGHAQREELREMLEAVRQFLGELVPVHTLCDGEGFQLLCLVGAEVTFHVIQEIGLVVIGCDVRFHGAMSIRLSMLFSLFFNAVRARKMLTFTCDSLIPVISPISW